MVFVILFNGVFGHDGTGPRLVEVENVAIAHALQLEAAQAMPALYRFNHDAMPSLLSPNLSIPYYVLLIHYFTM